MRFFKIVFLVCSLFATLFTSSYAAAAPQKILVAYFSRADENYNVGNITEGNTEIVAKFIAQKTGADLFKIDPVNPYPTKYDDCTRLARKELYENARPAIKEPLPNPDDYDLVFIGAPNWWRTIPMCVYTFLDKFSLNNKDTVVFITHEGAGLDQIPSEIKEYSNANIIKNFEMTGVMAQTDRVNASKMVDGWLSSLKLLKK